MNRRNRRAAAKQRRTDVASPGHGAVPNPRATVEVFGRALARNDRSPEDHFAIASAFAARGRLQDAAAHDQRAIALEPTFIDAYHHLARIFFHLGRIDEALGVLRRALDVGPTAETKELFIQVLRTQRFIPDVDDLRNLMVRALSEPWTRPSEVAPIAASLIKHDPAIRPYVERARRAWPSRLGMAELLGDAGLAAISEHRLLNCLLVSTPICDVDLERLLIALRFAMLEVASAESGAAARESALRVACALARQCFLNEYVYAHAGDELERACSLRDALASSVAAGAAVPDLTAAAVAAYFPLHSVMRAADIGGRSWSKPIEDLLAQQVAAPEQERQLRASIPVLTAIADEVSLQVRQQYEENPYPRWAKAHPPQRPTTIGQYLHAKFPPTQSISAGNDVLVAGCGTGQHAVETAQRFTSARVLAVDLSLSSLAYAKRQTRAIGLDNIEYAQADILELGSIRRRFDLIEAIGVLHHLAEPFKGWRVLLELLRPRGLMRIGVYSELARAHVKSARSFIAERGYRAIPDDIRRLRRELMDGAHNGHEANSLLNQPTGAEDFFTLSECRDLLFHVQEHRLTLPDIGAFLADNDLALLGFEVGAATQARYRSRFPRDAAMTDLASWQAFERENPDTFVGMYQFWVQKR
jgi:SAM-dependent methyltransferase